MTNEVRAAVIAVLLVVFAAGVGVTVGTRARPTPTPRPVPSPTTFALPSPTPVDPAEVQRRAFAQPLVSGCVAGRTVWLVADGGAAIRWDGRIWSIPDPTLRSLLAAECDQGTVLAVGRAGALLTIDEERRQVRADRFGIDDLAAVARASGGAVAVGPAGVVAEQSELGWRLVPLGATEDLYGVALSPSVAGLTGWIVGSGGAAYRYADGRWAKVDTGTSATLRAVRVQGSSVVAVGERGTILRYEGERWVPIAGATNDLRAIAAVGAATFWIVGDRGTVIEHTGDAVRLVDLGTTCTLRAVFAEGSAVWVVGSDGERGAAWRIAPTGTDRWGSC